MAAVSLLLHIIFLCLSQKPQGKGQGLLLTCNNSRGYGFPPLSNLTPGSSPGNRVKLEIEQTGQAIYYFMKLAVGYVGNMEIYVGRNKRKFCRVDFDKKVHKVPVTLCFLLNISFLLIHIN